MEISTLNILAIGRNNDILQVVERLINAHENWKATIVTTDEAAMTVFGQQKYPIVFLCAGVTAEEEEVIRQRLLQLDPSVVVIRHFGGGSGLLENEVRAILDSKGIRVVNTTTDQQDH